MGGYSKMSKPFGNPNPNSSDLHSSFSNTKPSPEATKETEHQEKETEDQQPHPQLRRNSSVSSAANHLKKRALSFSFSPNMRRSSSVSERYCRIHDQSSVFLPDSSSPAHRYGYGYEKMDPMPETAATSDDGPSSSPSSTSARKKKLVSKSGIVRACKKILGL